MRRAAQILDALAAVLLMATGCYVLMVFGEYLSGWGKTVVLGLVMMLSVVQFRQVFAAESLTETSLQTLETREFRA